MDDKTISGILDDMSKKLCIKLEDSTAAIIANENALLGLSEEDYVKQATEQKALQDILERAEKKRAVNLHMRCLTAWKKYAGMANK